MDARSILHIVTFLLALVFVAKLIEYMSASTSARDPAPDAASSTAATAATAAKTTNVTYERLLLDFMDSNHELIRLLYKKDGSTPFFKRKGLFGVSGALSDALDYCETLSKLTDLTDNADVRALKRKTMSNLRDMIAASPRLTFDNKRIEKEDFYATKPYSAESTPSSTPAQTLEGVKLNAAKTKMTGINEARQQYIDEKLKRVAEKFYTLLCYMSDNNENTLALYLSEVYSNKGMSLSNVITSAMMPILGRWSCTDDELDYMTVYFPKMIDLVHAIDADKKANVGKREVEKKPVSYVVEFPKSNA